MVKAAREQIASRNPNAFKEKIEVGGGARRACVHSYLCRFPGELIVRAGEVGGSISVCATG